MGRIAGLGRQRWAEARAAMASTDFDALADLGSDANRRLMLLLGGVMCTAAGLFALVVVLPYAGRLDVEPTTIVAISAAVLILGIVQLLLPAHTPMRVLDGFVVAAGAGIVVASTQGSLQLSTYVLLLFMWPAVGLVVLRSKQAALLHYVGLAAMAAVAIAIRGEWPEGLVRWCLVTVVLITTWQAFGWLVWRTRALAVSERRARELSEASTMALAHASDQKGRFLAAMSHELRTPLNAVIGFGELLGRGRAGPLTEQQEDYVADIVESGQHLLSLVEDTLDEAKVSAGRYELELSDVRLADAVDEAMRLVREPARRKSIRLAASVDPLGVVVIDERKVKQVMVNLLSNAVKFTPPGGDVEVSARRRGSYVELSVADTGPGITPGEHETIFEAYEQIGIDQAGVEGTGLGLALARKLVALHGGRIWVESQPGAGARFTFTLPDHPAEVVAGLAEGRRLATPVAERVRLLPMADIAHRGAVVTAWILVGLTVLGLMAPDAPGMSRSYFWFAAAIAGAGAPVLLLIERRTGERMGVRLLTGLLVLGTVVTYFGIRSAGPYAGFGLLVWVSLATFARIVEVEFGWRRLAWLHLTFVAVALALALATQPGNDAPVAQWLGSVATVWMFSFLVGRLLDRLQVLAVGERAAADEAARVAVELEAVSRHKGEFLAGMSHELRTPLNAVIGFAEVLEREQAGPLTPRQRAYVSDIVASGHHLLAVINDVLDLAKIDAGRVEIVRRPVDLGTMLDEVVARSAATATAKEVRFHIDVEPGLEVWADEHRIARAASELVANAVKFTPPGGSVAIVASARDEDVVVAVADTGPGVVAANADDIFEPFHQLDGAPARAREGAGLGLALARRLVELHGGTLVVEPAPSAGARFTMSLPGALTVEAKAASSVDSRARPTEHHPANGGGRG